MLKSGLTVKVAGEDSLADYASIPMEFTVNSVLDVVGRPGFPGGFSLREMPVKAPWVKDYRPATGESRQQELTRFCCEHNHAYFLALLDDRPVGAATGIRFCEDAEYYCLLGGSRDTAILHDIRVHPDYARQGVGTLLFGAFRDWAVEQRLGLLKIETQNINVPACRFYANMGAYLGGVQQHAYPEFPDEVQLLWFVEIWGRM